MYIYKVEIVSFKDKVRKVLRVRYVELYQGQTVRRGENENVVEKRPDWNTRCSIHFVTGERST